MVAQANYSIPNNQTMRCTQDPVRGNVPAGTRNVHMPRDWPCSNANNQQINGRVVQSCASDPNDFVYLNSGGRICAWQSSILPYTANIPISGPNMVCPTAILGLSGNKAQLMRKLDHMHPVPGGTHADVGLMWGLRVLSPRTEWSNFFGTNVAGRPAPGAWTDPNTRKMMILITDGVNVAPWHYEGYYGCNEGRSPDTSNRYRAGQCWRHGGVQRLDNAALDALMLDACEAIRNDYNIELYTIGVDLGNAAAADLLRQCAGDPNRSFDISASDLSRVMQSIASGAERLTK